MSNNTLEFEKPLLELEEKIKELRDFMEEKDLDLTDEIKNLKKRSEKLQEEIYNNLEPWQILKIARHPERPTTRDYIDRIVTDFIELHGDRKFGDDEALIGGIGLIDSQPVTIIGHQKGKTTKENIKRNFGMAHPEGYRKALRLMKQAEKFNRPVISLVNTPGAYPGIGAEERGQARAIAHNLQEMSDLNVPIIVVIIGEGGSGGALGIGLGDRVMMFEYSFYSVCSPEACAAILWKDADQAPAASDALSLTAADLKKLNIIDEIMEEPKGGAHKNKDKAASILKEKIIETINEFNDVSKEELLMNRYKKFRSMGEFSIEELNEKLNDAKTS